MANKENRECLSLRRHRSKVLIIGSGAAGLNAALQLHVRGIEDIIIITESLDGGTSINTGSDKQTYYKIGMNGSAGDSPRAMAAQYLKAGSMHGDLALVEAAVSARAFLNLVNLGVDFPTDEYGQFIGYQTDHDEVGRGSSVGPYTSRDMCRALIAEVLRRGIRIDENRHAARLVWVNEGEERRVVGALAPDESGNLHAYRADHTVFAVGGPGGLYARSVYPAVHIGAIGLALEAGALARGLPECQYGLASTKFRWNVSGTFMQVIPRFVSTDADGVSGEREFLNGYFPRPENAHSMVFLKGYQWPFDAAKLPEGSSLIDILVYIETVEKGRRVFLDFRSNPEGFDFSSLSPEAREYLEKSGALQESPLERLTHMNPGAVELYAAHHIDLSSEMLEIAVCAQHNNGGLAADLWWRSENLKGFYPVGEVNGSHGVARPGGSALNAGQVGGFRIAEILSRCGGDGGFGGVIPDSVDEGDGVFAEAAERPNPAGTEAAFAEAADTELPNSSVIDSVFEEAAADLEGFLGRCRKASVSWKDVRSEIQGRMTRFGAHIRSEQGLKEAVEEARRLKKFLDESGCRAETPRDAVQALRNRHLCLAHLVYLEAMLFQLRGGVGSRGSAMVRGSGGRRIHPDLDEVSWSFREENPAFRDFVLETLWKDDGVQNIWVPVRPLPQTDDWFETAWARYRNGEIYC